jgi:hypothetical protein
MVAAIDAYRFGWRISCQQTSSMNGSPTWKMTKLRSGKLAAAPVHVPGLGGLDRLGAEGDALVDPDQVDAQLLGLLEHREGDLGSSMRQGNGRP